MKPTHGFKNPLIGFGERQGRAGGGRGEAGVRGSGRGPERGDGAVTVSITANCSSAE